jgi:hypothetical protein
MTKTGRKYGAADRRTNEAQRVRNRGTADRAAARQHSARHNWNGLHDSKAKIALQIIRDNFLNDKAV